jgi:hypothetical protein
VSFDARSPCFFAPRNQVRERAIRAAMHAMLRALALVSFLASTAVVHADAPAPSQALASDPEPPRPSLGLSADGAAILVGDYAARLDVLVLPALSIGGVIGASHRRATDDVLLELVASLWCLGEGLEGPFVSAAAGVAWGGPWNQAPSWSVRLGGDAGWQFLWQSLSITLGAGAHAAVRDDGAVVPEARLRVALGLVF